MNLRTNSKVNLFLRVLGSRPDDYHEVESIYHSVGLADEISISASGSEHIEVEMVFAEGLSGELPGNADNLVYRAARLLAESDAVPDGVKIKITKRIPIAGGLGGGSGNAAGALVALAEHWALGYSTDALIDLSAQLGSDVPYCIKGGTAIASGRGEQLAHLATSMSAWFVLGISDRGLSTPEVYERWDQLESSSERGPAEMIVALGAGDLVEVASLLHNDLEPAAFSLRPELAEHKAALLEAGALGALLSGSGPTLFGLAATEAEARALASSVSGVFDRVEVGESRPACVEIEGAPTGTRR